MKILAIHADHLDFEAKKQAIKDPDPARPPEHKWYYAEFNGFKR